MPKCCSIVSISPIFPSPNFLQHKNWSKFYEFLTHLLTLIPYIAWNLNLHLPIPVAWRNLNSIPFARSSQHMNLKLGGVA